MEDVRRSHRTGIAGLWHKAMGEQVYRCKSCQTRFYVPETPSGSATVQERPESSHRRHYRVKRARRRRVLEVVAFIAIFTIFFFVLKYFLLDRETEPAASAATVLSG